MSEEVQSVSVDEYKYALNVMYKVPFQKPDGAFEEVIQNVFYQFETEEEAEESYREVKHNDSIEISTTSGKVLVKVFMLELIDLVAHQEHLEKISEADSEDSTEVVEEGEATQTADA